MTFDESACGGISGADQGWKTFESTGDGGSRNGFILMSTGVTSAMRKEATAMAAAKVHVASLTPKLRPVSFRTYADLIIGSLESRLVEESP